MKYFRIIFVFLIILSFYLIYLKFGISNNTFFYSFFVILTILAGYQNTKTLSVERKFLVPIIIYGIFINAIRANDIHQILNVLLITFCSYIIPWFILYIIKSEQRFGITPMVPATFMCIIGINRCLEFIIFSSIIGLICSVPYIAFREFRYNRKNFYNLIGMIFSLLLQIYSLKINNIIFLTSSIFVFFFGYKFIKLSLHKEPNQINYMPIIPCFSFATLLMMLSKSFSG